MLSQFAVLLIIPALAILSTRSKIKAKAERQSACFSPRSLALLPDAYLHASGSHPKSEVLKVGVPLEDREMQIDLWHKYADNLLDNEALTGRRYANGPVWASRHVFCLQSSKCSLWRRLKTSRCWRGGKRNGAPCWEREAAAHVFQQRAAFQTFCHR